MTVAAGTKLGPYEILAPLGAGGMGEVYRARDARLTRDVAIKMLSSEFSDDVDRLRRFEAETRAIGALNHPNILAIYDVGTYGGSPYLVSELLEGETLRQRLTREPIPVRRVLEYAIQMSQGLAAAHEQGIVHRDLKPENIFLTRDGRLKILDFGLAKLTQASHATDAATTTTDAGVIFGTVGYMAPEQVRGQPADTRSDLFACGVVLYEMLAGVRPFRGDSAVEVMQAVLKEDPPEIPTGKTVSPALEQLVRRCLEKVADQRFQSARDLGFVIQALSGSSSTGPNAAATGVSRAAFWRWILTAVALAGAVAGTYVMVSQRETRSSALHYQQLTFRRGVVWSARFAPDGQTIVYSAAWDGKPVELFSTRAEFPASRSLGLPSADLNAISPSGQLAVTLSPIYLADPFLRRGTLATLPLAGGTPREMLESVVGADYSPDGTAMAVVRAVRDRYQLEFPVGKSVYETTGYISDARISRDGKKVAFLEHPFRGDDHGAVAVVDSTGKKDTLSRTFSSEGGLSWAPDNNEVWFTASEGGPNLTLRAVSASGTERTLAAAPGRLFLYDAFPDGRVLLGHLGFRDTILGATPEGKGERDLSWLNGSLPKDISRDGHTLLFLEWGSTWGEVAGVCLRRMDGTPPVSLGRGAPQALSQDGNWALAIVHSAPTQVVLYPTGAGRPRTLPGGGLAHQAGAFFEDGKRVLLVATEANHGPRTYVQDIESGHVRALTPEGITGTLLSPDEKLLVVTNPERKWFTYELDGGAMHPVLHLEEDEQPIRFASDGWALFTSRTSKPEAFIYRVDLATGKRDLWKHLVPDDPAGVYDLGGAVITPDGRSYAYACTRALTDLYLVAGIR